MKFIKVYHGSDVSNIFFRFVSLCLQENDSDDINRIKRIFKKHWKLIKNNTLLNQIFPAPPVIAYKANPSLKKKPVRARLKPLDRTNPNPTTNTNGT